MMMHGSNWIWGGSILMTVAMGGVRDTADHRRRTKR